VTWIVRNSVGVLLRTEPEILLEKSSDLDEEEKCRCTAEDCSGDPVEVEQVPG